MRYREFKHIVENVSIQPLNVAPMLQKAAKDNAGDNNKQTTIQKLIAFLTQKAKEIVKQPAQQNEASADVDANTLDIYIKQMDANELQQFQKELQNPKVKQLLSTLVTKRKEIAGNIKSFIQKLVNKVTGSLDAIKQAYDEQRQEGDTDAPAKPQGQSVGEQLNIILTGLASYLPTEQKPTLIKFLEKCALSGIIDLRKLPDTGNISQLAQQSEFAKLLQTPVNIQGKQQPFLQSILQSKPAGTGAAAWGPGEAGLAILGTPVQKADTKGDLSVGGEKIEMKASSNPKKGGRISSEAVKSGKDAIKEVTPIVDNFLKLLKIKRTGKAVPSAFPKKKAFNIFNVGTNWFANMNEYIKSKDVKKDDVVSLLNGMAESAINKGAIKKEIPFNFSQAVDVDGTMNSNLVMKEYLRVTMAYYNQIENVGKILILNPVTGNFTTISATDIDSTMNKINLPDNEKGKVQLSTHVMDFSGNQAKISPQLGIA